MQHEIGMLEIGVANSSQPLIDAEGMSMSGPKNKLGKLGKISSYQSPYSQRHAGGKQKV